MAGERPFKGDRGVEVCQTHHGYTITIADPDGQVLIPPGCHFMDIIGNAEAIVYDIAAAKADEIDEAQRHYPVAAASTGHGLAECTPGHYINITHSDGVTNIGVLTIVFACGNDAPTTLTVTTGDPDA